MDYAIFDIETDGLIETVSKIHCLSVNKFVNGVSTRFSTTDYGEIKNFFLTEPVLIGHNIVRYDIPVVEKLLGIKVNAELVDTLGVSWYLYPTVLTPGLEYWGDKLGVQKPEIKDWSNLAVEDYIHRCETDVTINTLFWDKCFDYLVRIYADKGIKRILSYITFKLECAREQEEEKWLIDIPICQRNLAILKKEYDLKFEMLSSVMPKVTEYKIQSRPKVLFKQDGTLSVAGENWFALLAEKNLPRYRMGALKIPISESKGNPRSHDQLKSWLFDIGWIPETFKYAKNKDTGEVRKIPQISLTDGSDVCSSVKTLYQQVPDLIHIESFFKVNHRIGILEGFLESADEDGYIQAQIEGFTNTMRMQHRKPIANLPTIHKAYGKLIRECLIAPEGYVLCGSDMSSLEDSTKQHYMYFFDPEYVKEMRIPGFDPHLDIALQGKMLTQEQVDAHKEKREDHSKIRKDAKVVNFAAVYGAGAPKISLTTGWPVSKSKKLLEIYWIRNKSVKQVAAAAKTQTVDGQMWLYNPVSKMWYSLRAEKDKFSTLNQGTGVYCFDTWVRKVRRAGIRITMQYHDEIAFKVLIAQQEKTKQVLLTAIKDSNAELRLNVELGISVDFGDNYAAIH